MIGKLTGIIDETGEDFAVIDVGGVGYVVHCSARVLSNLPVAGQRTTLYVETFMWVVLLAAVGLVVLDLYRRRLRQDLCR